MAERLKKRLGGGVPHVAGNNKKNKTVKNKKVEYEHKGLAPRNFQNQTAAPKIADRKILDNRLAPPKYLKDIDDESTLNKIGNFLEEHSKKLKKTHDPKRLK